MSGKVDGFAPRIQISSGTSPAAPAAPAPTPAPAAAPAPSSPSPQTATAFDGSAPTRRFADAQTGAPVPTSANPQHLWGVGEGHGHHAHGDFAKNLTPEQIAELKAKRAHCQDQIDDRVGELEHKWKYARNTTKTNELWNYVHDSKKLDPETRGKIEQKLWKTDRDQARLDRLQARAKELGQSGTPEQRTELAHQIESAKNAISTDLNAANQVIKDAGLETDHLAHAESTIDPNAAKEGLPSLASLLDGFVKFTSQLFGVSDIRDSLSTVNDAIKENKVDDLIEHNRQLAKVRYDDDLAESLAVKRFGFKR